MDKKITRKWKLWRVIGGEKGLNLFGTEEERRGGGEIL